jgi:hypothetical protein
LLVALIAIGWTKKSHSEGSTTANFFRVASRAFKRFGEHYNKKPFGGPPSFYFVRGTPDGAFFYFMTDDLHLGHGIHGTDQLVGRPLVLAGGSISNSFVM